MTVLNVIDRYRNTEAVFRKYDDQAGVCICCQTLFETIADMAAKYLLNLDQLPFGPGRCDFAMNLPLLILKGFHFNSRIWPLWMEGGESR